MTAPVGRCPACGARVWATLDGQRIACFGACQVAAGWPVYRPRAAALPLALGPTLALPQRMAQPERRAS